MRNPSPLNPSLHSRAVPRSSCDWGTVVLCLGLGQPRRVARGPAALPCCQRSCPASRKKPPSRRSTNTTAARPRWLIRCDAAGPSPLPPPHPPRPPRPPSWPCPAPLDEPSSPARHLSACMSVMTTMTDRHALRLTLLVTSAPPLSFPLRLNPQDLDPSSPRARILVAEYRRRKGKVTADHKPREQEAPSRVTSKRSAPALTHGWARRQMLF